MNSNLPDPSPVPFWDRTVTIRLKPRRLLASVLAVGLVAAMGVAGYTGYTRLQEQKQLRLAKAQVAEEFARLEPKARTQLQWLQDRLAAFQTQLTNARKATRSSSLSLSSYRDIQTGMREQLDAVKQTLREIAALEENAYAEFRLPSSSSLLTSDQREAWQDLVSEQNALENQLQQITTDLAALQDHRDRLAQNEAAAAIRAKAARYRNTEYISGYSPAYSYYENRWPAYRRWNYRPYYSPYYSSFYYHGCGSRYHTGMGIGIGFVIR
jgi:hypothetical protein